VIDRTAVLESIHARLAGDPTLGDTLHIDDPTSLSALMSMAPDPEGTRNGDRWVESRCERLTGGRSLFAVIARDEHGQLWVTAHSDPSVMNAQQRRITEEILGRPRGVQIRNMNALELLHRTVVNEHGAAFHVGGLYLDGETGHIVVDLLDMDEDGNPIPGTECGIYSLDGWEVH
jgi:hypothetical protein